MEYIIPGIIRRSIVIITLNLIITGPDLLVAHEQTTSDWHQFRGSHRNGTAEVHYDFSDQPAAEPVILWQKEIGSGFSEIVVSDNMVYTMIGEKIDSISGWEFLVCHDLLTGEEIWKVEIDKIFIDEDDWGDGPRSTPVVDDHDIYCFSASGKLASVSRADGKKRWAIDFVEQYGSTRPRWGYSTSPLLVDNMVIMEVGGVESMGFAAFNKDDGEIIWAAETITSAYNSPISVNIDGETQIIFANASKLFSFSPSGNLLWTFDMPVRSPMASPLFIAPDKLFVSAANDAGSFIIKINNNIPEQLMTSNQMRNDWSSSTYKDGYIYGFNVATLQCMNAESGARQWLKRGFGKGSLIMVGNRLVVLSDQGALTIVEVTPDEYKEIATVDILEGRSWTAPSFSNGKLLVRNLTHMVCIDLFPDNTAM
jgi:outer membrane protein assembly factor BamB